MNTMYKFFIHGNNIDVELIGGITEEIDDFVALYTKAISKVKLNSSTLNIECIRLATPNGTDMKNIMKPCFLLYKSTGFEKINIIVCKAQKCFKRNMEELAKELCIDNMEVIVAESLSGVLDKKYGRLLP